MMPRKSPFRSLFAVYFLAFLVGVFEIFSGSNRREQETDIYGDVVYNFPEAMSRLYPGSPEAEYLIGRRYEAMATRRIERDERLPLSQAVNELNAGLAEAARHYERAIDIGLKSEEGLYYNYALALIRSQAEPARIDRAVAEWRRNFPYSTRRDLAERRRAIEQQLRQLPLRAQTPDSGAGSETMAALEYVPEWRTPPGYVGSQACRQCHPHEFDTYLETAHSRALSDVHPEDEPADAVFDHATSGRRFRVARRDGKLIHEESLLLNDGTEFPLTSTPLRYRAGSGHYARTYLCEAEGGFLFESPITWYESAKTWGMTPGFDKPGHRSFTRPVLENCLRCHSGRVAVGTESSFRLKIVEHSIGCERCHGPGETHVKMRLVGPAANPADDPIVNPRRLSRKLSEAVCQQCHLQADIHIAGRDVWEVDYRPGQALEKFQTVYRLRKDENGMTVVGHVEQLGGSACYRRSETLQCVTCHNPHRMSPPDRRVEHYRSVCNSCHAHSGCRLSRSIREERSGNDCVQCHMPKSATEVPHVAFTHHRIGIHPLKNDGVDADHDDPLVRLSDLSGLSDADRVRSLMLARFEMFLKRGADFQKSAPGEQLAGQIDSWLRSLPPDGDVPIEFARTQFLSARGNSAAAVQSAGHALALDGIRTAETTILLNQLGMFDFGERRYDQARLRFGKLARLQCQGQDWFYLGLSEALCGRSEAAMRALERARQLEPAAIEIYESLSKILHSRGEFAVEQRIMGDIRKLERAEKWRRNPSETAPISSDR